MGKGRCHLERRLLRPLVLVGEAAEEVSDGEVNVVPIVDSTRIALAGILLVAWSVYWIGKTIRVLKGRWSVG